MNRKDRLQIIKDAEQILSKHIQKPKKWLFTTYHVCRICGEQWVTQKFIYGSKPSQRFDRHETIVEQYHCINI